MTSLLNQIHVIAHLKDPNYKNLFETKILFDVIIVEKTGHCLLMWRQCRLSSQKSNTVGQQKSEHISVQNIPKSVCSFCAKTGHSVENCFTKNAIEQRRKINFCTLFQSVVPTDVDVDGNKFQGLIDTGADVSLISDKHQSLFADKIQSCSIVIRGITQGSIEINKLFCRR